MIPSNSEIAPIPPQEFADRLQAIPHRQFSIASIKADRRVHLLVRQVRHANGLGLATGWLTHHASLGSAIEMRISRNPGFHLPANDRPLILIGNGTGLAGLRTHLKARIQAEQKRNWLIFGERNSAHDYYYRDEIESSHKQGMLEKLDPVFSRDQAERRYVQHRLLAYADTVRAWLNEGAYLMVCGSAEGLAPGVDAALVDIIGADSVEHLMEQGRYRRDVY